MAHGDRASGAPAHALEHRSWEALAATLRTAIERRGEQWADRRRALDAAAVLDAAAGTRAAADPEQLMSGRLRAVGVRFGLGDVGTDLLWLAVATELDPTVHLLLGLLSGDSRPERLTVAVAAECLGLDLATDPRIAAAVRSDAPGPRWGVLTAAGDGALPGRRLRTTAAVVAEAQGARRWSAAISPLLDPPVTLPGTAAEQISEALRSGQQLVWLHAPSGTSGAACAMAGCAALDVPAFIIDVRRSPVLDGAPDPDAVRDLVRVVLREVALQGGVAVVVGAELLAPARDLLTEPPLPVIAVARTPWDVASPAALTISVTAPTTSIPERQRMWWPLLGGRDPDPAVAALRLTPEEIIRVARHAKAQAQVVGEERLGTDRILSSSRAMSRGHSDPADRARGSLDDLVLPSDVRSELDRLLSWARLKDQVRPGGPQGQRGTGVCALFSGSPGTGKTLAAHVLADHLGMDLFQVELAAVVDKYIGETEKNLERVFAAAEASNSLLFFDEADALFGSRSEVKDARDRYANQEVAYLLQRMEQFDGITILATNLRGNLDPAFSRRLQFIVHFPDPDEPTRKRIWERHLEGLAIDPEDPPELDVLAARVELAGGDIRNIVLAAAVDALAAGRAVGMTFLAIAVNREFAKLGRRTPGLRGRWTVP